MSSHSTNSSSAISEEREAFFLGEVLDNKYLLIYKIGSGACASVWLSMNINTKKYYAIKIQNPEDYDDGVAEVDLLKKLSTSKCKYINALIEHFIFIDKETEDEYICMVFELLAGSLYDIIRIGKYSKGLPLKTVRQIINQLLIAMDIVNREHKILHTDIKPENILVVGVNNRDKEIIKLIENNKNLQNLINNFKKKGVNLHDKKKEFKKTLNMISFEEINYKYNKNKETLQDNIEIIDEKYIIDIQIKLADFGLCTPINYSNFDIQTRHYRAPEIILGYEYNENCDMWSVGCLVYELLIGDVLFNPSKYHNVTTSRCHIYDMICLFGKIPEYLINKSLNKSNFYKQNGTLKGIYEVEFNPFTSTITAKIADNQITGHLFDFLNKTFVYDPFKRLTVSDALKHPFIREI